MAVTKTHPIKSTLKKAIDYICNLDKTDGKLLVSSFGCAAETADIEFAWTRKHSIDKGTNLGCHLIQAFEPGETTPEQAHEIGMQLAKEILGGKYKFVLTTRTQGGPAPPERQKRMISGLTCSLIFRTTSRRRKTPASLIGLKSTISNKRPRP